MAAAAIRAQVESEYLTAKELAALLRIKERKVYELASSGELPCSRAMGKLLFPRRAVDAWLARSSTGLEEPTSNRPKVLLGSHDPLLEWALRESRSGLAAYFDGSQDGLDRFARGEGLAAGLHLPAAGGPTEDAEGWNVEIVRRRFAEEPVILVEWAWRERGLVLPPGQGGQVGGLAGLKGLRLAPRQAGAGSQTLLEQLLKREGMSLDELALLPAARTETEAVLAVYDGKADAAFGIAALARQFRLDFVPLVRERFDLLVDRWAWFEPPMQALLSFCHGEAFRARVAEYGGYDISGLGRVHFNGAKQPGAPG